MRSECYYLDDQDNIVEGNKTTRVVIRELDDDGNLVREIFGTTGSQLERRVEDDEQHELTLEQQEFLANFEKEHKEAMSKR